MRSVVERKVVMRLMTVVRGMSVGAAVGSKTCSNAHSLDKSGHCG